MSTVRVQFTTELVGDSFQVTAEALTSPTVREIFLFENSGETSLGNFIGVVDVDQLTHYPKWTGDALSTFAVKFLRHHTATQMVKNVEEADQWKLVVRQSVESFLTELGKVTTEVITVDITI